MSEEETNGPLEVENASIKCSVLDGDCENPILHVGFEEIGDRETLDALGSLIALISHENFVANVLAHIKEEFEEHNKNDELTFLCDRILYHKRTLGVDQDEDPVCIKPSELGAMI